MSPIIELFSAALLLAAMPHQSNSQHSVRGNHLALHVHNAAPHSFSYYLNDYILAHSPYFLDLSSFSKSKSVAKFKKVKRAFF